MPLASSTPFGAAATPSACPTPVDNFNSYSLGAFPGGGDPWSVSFQSGSNPQADIVNGPDFSPAGDTFSTQVLRLQGSGVGVELMRLVYDPLSFQNGVVQCNFMYDGLVLINHQICVIGRVVDANNFLTFRVLPQTSDIRLYETIGGTDFLRGTVGGLGAINLQEEFSMKLEYTNLSATITLFESDCETVVGTGTFATTTQNSGKAGVYRISSGIGQPIYYENFYAASA